MGFGEMGFGETGFGETGRHRCGRSDVLRKLVPDRGGRNDESAVADRRTSGSRDG